MRKVKRRIALITAIAVLASVLPFTGCGKIKYDFNAVKSDWKDVQVSSGKTDKKVLPTSGVLENVQDKRGYSGDVVLFDGEGCSVTYSVTLEKSDRLALFADYYILHSGLSDSEVSIEINGKVVSERSSLKALWKNEEGDFKTDSFGNEIVPSQEKVDRWVSDYLYEYDFATVLPPVYDFKEGENTITLAVNNGGEFLLGDLFVRSVELPQTYDSYISGHKNAKFGGGIDVVEAEDFHYKNNLSTVPATSAAVNVTPYKSYVQVLNVISGFSSPSQILTYELNAASEGLYNISFNYLNDNSNRTVYAQFFLDGKTPYRELLRYPLVENGGYSKHVLGNGEGNYSFFLTAGKHTFSVKIDGSLSSFVRRELTYCINELNSVYLELKKIAGTSDSSREWDVENDFPGVVDKLKTIGGNLDISLADLRKINGSNVNYQALIYIQTARKALDGLLKTPKYIPNKYAEISEGSGSIVQTLANSLSDIQVTPLAFDKIVLHPADKESGIKKVNGFVAFWEGVKSFFHSFITDYSNVTDDEKTIQVWVARSRQYVDLMQQMIDGSTFTKDTGYKVKFSILADEGKLILSNAAGIAPNSVMGISNWLPYEMGIRNLVVDLTKFSDYGQVIQRFSSGAMISLIADGIGLALPETQDFYVTYYRKDILKQYNISVPDTWDDMLKTLPELQRYGLNYYVPLSTSTASKSIMTTAPFIYQYGGSLFTDDGTATTISEEGSLNAIKFMTELYTLYGLPQQVSNFFDSFRSGSLPIGISTFETYLRLNMAAPEISGKWGIALSPGKKNEKGIIERWQAGSATAMTLIKSGSDEKDKAGWELLKWWSSAKVQTEFMNRLTMIYGKSYIWNSANNEAFSNSVAFSSADKKIIKEQWEWMREIPKVPGWYMLERELSNSWNSIVIDGQNTRSVVENAVNTIDKELKRKLTEFGYLESGKIKKPYRVTTLEYVESLKRGG